MIFFVSVLDPSDPPQDPTVEDYDKDYVEIGWKPPLNDGGAPIEKYVLEKCEKGKPQWQPVCTLCFKIYL